MHQHTESIGSNGFKLVVGLEPNLDSDIQGMEDQQDNIYLHRIDRALNMHRFYSMTIQPTLFGEASLIRNWGRIGTQGQTMIQTFPTPAEASSAFARIQALKRRKAYRHPDPGTGP